MAVTGPEKVYIFGFCTGNRDCTIPVNRQLLSKDWKSIAYLKFLIENHLYEFAKPALKFGFRFALLLGRQCFACNCIARSEKLFP